MAGTGQPLHPWALCMGQPQASSDEAPSKKGVFNVPLDWLPTELHVPPAGPLCDSWVLLALAGEQQAQHGVPSWGGCV